MNQYQLFCLSAFGEQDERKRKLKAGIYLKDSLKDSLLQCCSKKDEPWKSARTGLD